MMRLIRNEIFVIMAALAVAAAPSGALARASTEIATTLIMQVENKPADNKADIWNNPAGKPDNEPAVKSMTLDVSLTSLPPDATLKDCSLRLVTADQVSKGHAGGVVLQLLDPAAGSAPAVAMDTRAIDFGAKKGSEIEFAASPGATNPICDFLEQGRKQSPPAARFNVQMLSDGGQVTIYTNPSEQKTSNYSPADQVLYAPRLKLTYRLLDSSPGRADWSQARADAQHTGRSKWRLYDDPAGDYTPSEFAVRTVGGENATFGDIKPPRLLLYGRQILAVSKNRDQILVMDGGGAVVRMLPLRATSKFIAVSQHGWVYDIGEDSFVLQRIEGGDAIKGQIEKSNTTESVEVPPTIGADGGFYLVTNQYVYAYPAPPAANGLPLWRVRITATNKADVSAVVLSRDGRTAYIVDKKGAKMIALETATGSKKWELQGLVINKANNDPMPVPLFADGRVFIASNRQSDNGMTSVIYMVTDNGDSAELSPSLFEKGNTSMTVAAFAGPDGSIYFIRVIADNPVTWLERLKPSDEPSNFMEQWICYDAQGFTDVRGDGSGNVYALNAEDGRFRFIAASAIESIAAKGVPGPACPSVASVGVEKGAGDFAVAPDGTIYSYGDTGKIQAISPTKSRAAELVLGTTTFSPDAAPANVTTNNDTTFRAALVKTKPGLILPADADINIVAQQQVAFAPGLSIRLGARLHARVGF